MDVHAFQDAGFDRDADFGSVYTLSKLNCFQCRADKKKCDREAPFCTRCLRQGSDCMYPGGRLRAGLGVKRKKVKELEMKIEPATASCTQGRHDVAAPARGSAPHWYYDTDLAATAQLEDLVKENHIVATGSQSSLPISNGGTSRRTANELDHPRRSSFNHHLVPDPQSSSIHASDALAVRHRGAWEFSLPANLQHELVDLYFSKLHATSPMLHPSRYRASLLLPPRLGPPNCLRNIIMALAASISPAYRHLSIPLYQQARQAAEADEMKDQGEHFTTVAHVQCWILMAHFEAQQLMFSRASMSLTRSVRIVHMLHLHRLDAISGSMSVLPPPVHWLEHEERRRTFWAVFCADRLTSSTTEWPSMIPPKTIDTLLPTSEEAFESGVQEATTFLGDAFCKGFVTNYSPFAGKVLASHLFHRTLQHTAQHSSVHAEDDLPPLWNDDSAYWDQHHKIDHGLTSMLTSLPGALRLGTQTPNQNSRAAPVPRPDLGNSHAVFVNINILTSVICLHRAAMSRIIRCYEKVQADDHSTGLPTNLQQLFFDSKSRLLPAAVGILHVIHMMLDIETSFKSPVLAFSTYQAAHVFVNDFVETGNRESEKKLDFLLDILVILARGKGGSAKEGEGGSGNPVAGSLVVQLAMDMKKEGIGSEAVEKVRHLMPDASNMPLFALPSNGSSARVVFWSSAYRVPDDHGRCLQA